MTTFGVVISIVRRAALPARKYSRRIDSLSRWVVGVNEQIILIWWVVGVNERAIGKAEEGNTPDIKFRPITCKNTRQ